MREGAWINARTGKYWWVDEHCRFVKRPQDADQMELPTYIREKIAPLTCGNGTGPEREAILLAVMKAGYIRFRGHGAQLTCEFYGDTYTNLWASFNFLQQMAGPMSHCVINNLKTNEQISLSFQELEQRMKEDEQSVLRIAKQILAKGALPITARDYKRAAGFPRLMQIMKGLVPSVHTFGIMSVDNPQGQPASLEYNQQAKARFKMDLKQAQYGYVVHNGTYGVFEHAFFIMNVRYGDLLRWCDPEHYNQESFIYGEVDHKTPRVVFKFIQHGHVEATRDVVLMMHDGVEDFFSESHGRKFQIPFFDEAYEIKEQDTNIPAGAPFTLEEAEANPENKPHIATIRACDENLRLNAMGLRVGMGAWADRGKTLAALNKIKGR